MMNRVPLQAQTYGFPAAAGLPQQRAMGMAGSPQPPSPQQQQNKGTLVPGQVLRVGKIQVTVDRYLSEGGFAHVYLVKTAEMLQGSHTHVLKRVAVRERRLLDEVRREVEVMKLLRGHPNIVHLHDADAFHLPDGTHEVLILMEFCAGGGIIDLLNSRLQSRLAEHEILQIFVDVCEGVAKMHSLRPKPLVHRDLKVENILQAGEQSFKLCDFGSAAFPRPPPTTLPEIKEVELDINTHTTMQYRSPEMVDVYQRRPIDEKADIWALGVFLYKLCYYTTPFEEHGPLAILNVQYRVPPYPVYSNQLNLLVGSMLQEHGSQRPSAVQLLKTVHSMRGTRPQRHYDEPISSQSQGSGTDLFDIISSVGSPSPNPPPVAASITPMRRGRPTKAPAPSASPQIALPVADPKPLTNKGPAPQPLSPQYTLPSEPLNAPAGFQQQQPSAGRPAIDVTGEKSPAPSPAPGGPTADKPYDGGSWSTFGSASGSTNKPSPKPTATTFDGFADLEEPPSIGTVKTASSQASGFSAFLPSSAQGSLGPPPSLPPRKSSSSSFSAASAFDGFADSFTGSFQPLSSSPKSMNGKLLSPRPPSAASASGNDPLLPRQTTQTIGKLAAPAPPPAGPVREPSFDERYPSVEELDLRSASTSPLPSAGAPSAASHGGFVAHAGRSYTGSAGQPTPSIIDKKPVFPLPRSTQVTGVTMRAQDEAKLRSSAADENGAADVSWGEDNDGAKGPSGAFSSSDKRGPAPKKQLDDWLTGDASPAQDAPTLKPILAPQSSGGTPSAGPSSATSRPPVALKPATLASGGRPNAGVLKGPRSPPPKAAKPPALKTTASSSIMSEQWSPVEAARAKLQTPTSTMTPRADSSDEEPTAPEEPIGGGPSSSGPKSTSPAIFNSPPVRSWSKPDPLAPKPAVAAAKPQRPPSTHGPPSFATSNGPRRLPMVDSDSAASFLRGSSTLGRASTISSTTASARPRPRPQSLYSSSSFGGAAENLKSSGNDPKLSTISDTTADRETPSSASAAHLPSSGTSAATQPSLVPLIAPKPQRRTSVSNVAQRYERGSPLSPTSDGGSKPLGAVRERFGGDGGALAGFSQGQSRTSTLAKDDPPPLKNITPEATGGPNAPVVVSQPARQAPPADQGGDEAEEPKSVKSLISRWNQQR